MSFLKERNEKKLTEAQTKALAVFQHFVFVKEFSVYHHGDTYRITENKSLHNTLYLGGHAFRVGIIFKASDLQKILDKHDLTFNSLSISNRR